MVKTSTTLLFLTGGRLAGCAAVQENGQGHSRRVGRDKVEFAERGNSVRRHLGTSTQEDATRNRNLRTSRVVVRYSNDQGRLDALALGSKVYHDFTTEKLVVLELDDDSIAQLEQYDANILSVEGDNVWEEQGFLEAHYDPQVRRLGEITPYGVGMVQADQVKMGQYPVTVCIADTGAARSHPDLKKAQLSGKDLYVSSIYSTLKWNRDSQGHGTHVAGVISAVPNNGIGVKGIGEIPLYITRALDDNGHANESDAIDAVKQCVASGAKIISMSLGGGGMSTSFQNYLNELYSDHDILIFAASGNNGTNVETWPSALPAVVSVSAIDQDESLWSGSNWGSWVEMTAPGRMVLSTSVDDKGKYVYSYYSGTSQAVPHAAGVAALLWSNHPRCKNYQIRYAMAVTARDLGADSGRKGCDEKFGHGLVQAKSALDYLDSNLCSQRNWGESASQGGCYAWQGSV